ncbi:MAG: EscU/YscU/HrcU family type III secretion system export apparatus switch protein [Pseudomonadales bacterium]|nr:EscU/YscU/HrcU family type III secretion system export apparatus switch protein [Pseudomonadales bacterium]
MKSEKKAVALKYDGQHAPQVTARGEQDLALEIMQIAEAFSVPMFQQTDLAELLYQLELNDEIPEALYIAVAEIISFAYMIAGKSPEDSATSKTDA